MNKTNFDKQYKRLKAQRIQDGKLGVMVEPYILPYRIRSGEFRNHGNLDFNPFTGLGHSYHWYEIAKRIKGRQVLNTYGYSASTSGHVYVLGRLMRQLKLKYVTIEAPRGLQDLDAAARHCLKRLAETLVKEKYGRVSYKSQVKQLTRELALIRQFGGKQGTTLKAAVKQAELDRVNRLIREREERKQKQIDWVIKRCTERGNYVQY